MKAIGTLLGLLALGILIEDYWSGQYDWLLDGMLVILTAPFIILVCWAVKKRDDYMDNHWS